MRKKILIFTQKPPTDKKGIHIWVGKTTLPHEERLCQILKLYLGRSPLNLDRSPTGKLYLPDSSLHFNISDSEKWLSIAFSWEAPVGIDIEKVRPIEEMQQMVEDYFSPREKSYVYPKKGIDKKESMSRFWEIWNRKEACFKALGTGLQDEMSLWDCAGDDWISVNNLWVRSVQIKHGLSAAVAITK